MHEDMFMWVTTETLMGHTLFSFTVDEDTHVMNARELEKLRDMATKALDAHFREVVDEH